MNRLLRLNEFSVNRARDMIFWFKTGGHIIYANIASCNSLGYSREELSRMKVADIDPSYDADKWALFVDGLKKSGSVTYETGLLARDGSVIPVEVTCNYLDYHGDEYLTAFARDITLRKNTEDELKETSSYLESLINYANAPIIVWDPGFRITRFNHAFERLTGYTSDEMIGRELSLLFSPESREDSLIKIERTLTGEYWESVEIPIQRKDGNVRIALWNSANIYAEDGKTLLATIAQGQDITDRKRAEEALQDAKVHTELYLDLMGHDINNMNQIGMGFLELALDTLKLDDDSRKLLTKPLEALEGSTKLIDNVRKLQKVKEGGLKFEEINVTDLIRQTIPKYSNIVGRNITIYLTTDVECHVMANDLMSDVFSNIIGNAIKHSSGALTIGIHVNEERADDKNYCKVAIEDNGPGIPDELKSKLFTKFYRGSQKVGGRGLGLYLVKTLIVDFHGKAWVEDRVIGDHSKGARFVVMLPTIDRRTSDSVNHT